MLMNRLLISQSVWLVFSLVILITGSLTAQYRIKLEPFSYHTDFDIESVFISAVQETEKQFPAGELQPMMVGVTRSLQINPLHKGSWIFFPEQGLKVWRMMLKLEQSMPLSLYFNSFDPGVHGRLYVFNSERTQLLGAFTRESLAAVSQFAIEPIHASTVIIQFETRMDAHDFHIELSELGLLFHPAAGKGFGTSGPCQVNVNCSEGANWQRQKRGVARILVKQGSALFFCSGSLINNVRADATPYFLTANHCGEFSSASDYAQWIFAFNYEAPECANPIAEPQAQTLTGAQLVSKAIPGTTNGSDFKLLKLLQDVPVTYNPYFNGWTRLNQATQTGAGIHHPDGDVKKISTYTSMPASSGYGVGGNNPQEKYWRLQWAPTTNGHGVTEGGSSGSPLFDNNSRIIGILTGGNSSCSNTSGVDFYGKLSFAWESNGTAAENQLKPWLDPDNSGIDVLGGLGSDTLFIAADFVAKRNELSINQMTEFENLSSGKITSYSWQFEGGVPASSQAKTPPPVLYEQYGTYDVKLVVSNNTITDTLIRKKYISVKPFLYPNPASGSFELSFGVDLSSEIEVQIFDASGREVGFESRITGSKLTLVLHNPNRGLYIVRVLDRFVDKNMKLLIVR